MNINPNLCFSAVSKDNVSTRVGHMIKTKVLQANLYFQKIVKYLFKRVYTMTVEALIIVFLYSIESTIN